MSRQTTVIFSVVSGRGRISVNGASVSFGAITTITDGDTVNVSKRGRKRFNVSLENTGTEYAIVLTSVNVPLSSGPVSLQYRSGSYTALVGSIGVGIFNFNIPTARYEDLVTSDPVENASFFTYNNSGLVSTNIRSPKIFCFDSSTPIFKFITYYYDLTASELKSFVWTYDSEVGTTTYGTITTINTVGNLNVNPGLAAFKSRYTIDVVKISTTKCIVMYYVLGASPAVSLVITTCTISGVTITPAAASGTLKSSVVVILANYETIRPRIKLLSATECFVIYYDIGAGDGNAAARIVYIDDIQPEGFTISNEQQTAFVDIDNVSYAMQGFEVIDQDNITIVCLYTNEFPYAPSDERKGLVAVKYAIANHNPFTLTRFTPPNLLYSDLTVVPTDNLGQGDVIKLSTDKYVFYAQNTSLAFVRMALANYDGSNFVSLDSVTQSIVTLQKISSTAFLTYSYYNGAALITKYDTSTDNLTTTTTITVPFSTIEEDSISVFDNGSRFIVSNILDGTGYCVLSGSTTPLAKMTDFKPAFLVAQGGGPLVPTTTATTMSVGVLPSTTYYTHTQTGAFNDIVFPFPQYIDDNVVIIGTTDATGSVLTFA